MKSIYNQSSDIDQIVELLSAKKILEEKTRISLYLPKVIVKLMDQLSQKSSRGDLVSSLVLEKIKKSKKVPYGMFSPLEISEKEINTITASWDKKADELS